MSSCQRLRSASPPPLDVHVGVWLSALVGVQELPSQEHVRGAIARILAVPPFTKPAPSWIEQLITTVKQSIDDLKYWAVQQLGEWLGSSGLTGPAVIAILVLVAVALFASVVWSVVRPRAGERSKRSKELRSSSVVTLPLFADRLEAARELAADGQFADAMITLYQGACLWLDEGGHAHYELDKTGGDYERELESSKLRAGFRQLLNRFYPVAYGGREASSATWSRMRSAATNLGVPE